MKNYEEISEKIKPLKKLSGAGTLKICVEMSDAILRIRNIKNNPTNAYENAFRKTLELLRKAETPYMLTGAIASSYYGLPRTTYDIDVVVDPQLMDANKFINLARGAGFKVHKQEILELIRVGNRFTMQSRGGFKIDFWLARTEFERMAFKRKRRAKIYNQVIWVCSPEDIILSKLRSGRPRDIEDIEGMLARLKRLDKNYLLSWASEFNLKAQLKKIMKKYRLLLRIKFANPK